MRLDSNPFCQSETHFINHDNGTYKEVTSDKTDVIYNFVKNDWSTRLHSSTQHDVNCVCYKRTLNLAQIQRVLGFSLETELVRVLVIVAGLILICLLFYCKQIT